MLYRYCSRRYLPNDKWHRFVLTPWFVSSAKLYSYRQIGTTNCWLSRFNLASGLLSRSSTQYDFVCRPWSYTNETQQHIPQKEQLEHPITRWSVKRSNGGSADLSNEFIRFRIYDACKNRATEIRLASSGRAGQPFWNRHNNLWASTAATAEAAERINSTNLFGTNLPYHTSINRYIIQFVKNDSSWYFYIIDLIHQGTIRNSHVLPCLETYSPVACCNKTTGMMHSIVPSQAQQQPAPDNHGVSKTPARSGTRRVLGDISNRKTSMAATFQNDNGSSKTPMVVKKPTTTSTSNYYTEPKKSVPASVQPETLRKNHNNNTSTTIIPLLQVPPHPPPYLRPTTTTTKRNTTSNVTFILPDDTLTRGPVMEPSQSQPNRSSTDIRAHFDPNQSSSLWNYQDESEIEFPAGRLHHEQQRLHEDDDYDDDASQLSLEGATTFRDEFVDWFRREHSDEMEEQERHVQYCTQQLEHNCIITDDGTYIQVCFVINTNMCIHPHLKSNRHCGTYPTTNTLALRLTHRHFFYLFFCTETYHNDEYYPVITTTLDNLFWENDHGNSITDEERFFYSQCIDFPPPF